jgi:hypothetical protein
MFVVAKISWVSLICSMGVVVAEWSQRKSNASLYLVILLINAFEESKGEYLTNRKLDAYGFLAKKPYFYNFKKDAFTVLFGK